METPPPSPEEQAAAVDFIVRLARALHVYGTPAYRLEEALGLCAARFGIKGQFFCTPTAILASFDTPATPGVRFIRVEPSGISLQKLVHMDEVLEEVLARKLSPPSGSARIDAIETAAQPWGPPLIVASHAVASGTSTLFMGGGANELAVSSGIGLVAGALSLVLKRSERTARIFEPVAAALASALAVLAGSLLFPLSVEIATLGGVIVLLPGFTTTVAMRELATGHLIAGTARLMGAGLTFLSIGFGTALGSRVGRLLPGVAGPVTPEQFPAWAELVGVVLAPAAFAVLFQARPRDFGWILAAGALAFYGSRLGSEALGPELGVSFGAAVLGMAANSCARRFGLPATVPVVPGLLVLVPGSIGFLSVTSLVGRDVVSGIDMAFRMVMVAISLVAGLLVAHTVVPPRRPL